MVLDTSAIVAVLLGEPERDLFIALLAGADDPLISAATLVEASIVMAAKTGDEGVSDLDDLLAAAAVRCVAVDAAQALLARDAPAGLNFGDCFSYALAKAADRPLLFKGTDFSQADVTPAIA